jgi:hypothetical protein
MDGCVTRQLDSGQPPQIFAPSPLERRCLDSRLDRSVAGNATRAADRPGLRRALVTVSFWPVASLAASGDCSNRAQSVARSGPRQKPSNGHPIGLEPAASRRVNAHLIPAARFEHCDGKQHPWQDMSVKRSPQFARKCAGSTPALRRRQPRPRPLRPIQARRDRRAHANGRPSR